MYLTEREGERVASLLHVPSTLCCWQRLQCQHARYSTLPGQLDTLLYQVSWILYFSGQLHTLLYHVSWILYLSGHLDTLPGQLDNLPGHLETLLYQAS